MCPLIIPWITLFRNGLDIKTQYLLFFGVFFWQIHVNGNIFLLKFNLQYSLVPIIWQLIT